MTTSYPTAIDSYGPVPANQNTAVKHHDRHQNVEDAVIAIQTAVGITGSPNFPGQFRTDLFNGGYRFGNDAVPTRSGFFKDDDPATKLHRFRDRVFFGDASSHTGRRTAPYGDDWLSDSVGTWLLKNTQVGALSSEGRIGFLAGSHRASGATSTGTTIGLAGVTYNAGTGTTTRAGYFDATASGSNTTSTYGIEVAVTNRGIDAAANSYSVGAGAVIGQHMTPEGGTGYTIGDSDTPVSAPTAPGTLAINIGSGSAGGANSRWNLGIRFSAGSITGTDGTTGTGIAIGMAKGHTIEWRASNTILGATLRSDVSAVAGQDVGLLFKNNEVQITGTGENPIARFQVDTVGTPVNNLQFKNGRTGISPTIIGAGTDTNVGVTVQAQAAGTIRFTGQGGNAESLRLQFNANYVNFGTVTGSLGGAAPTWGVAGTDTNINWVAAPKGTGVFGVSYAATNATTPGNFSATRTIAIVANGVTLFVPAATAVW